MPQHALSILILKPTKQFIAFIASQIPYIEWPLRLTLENTGTVYQIPKCEDDESVLEILEASYAEMFQHEACCLIGKDLAQHIEGSFFDFLCCFKFKLYANVVNIESNPHDHGMEILSINRTPSILMAANRRCRWSSM